MIFGYIFILISFFSLHKKKNDVTFKTTNIEND